MDFRLVPMSMDHYDEAYSFWEKTEGISLHDTDSRDGMEKFLKRNPGLSSVAIFQKEIIGTILCSHDGRRGYLHHLAVKPDFRDQGLGKKLVNTSVEKLAQEEIVKINIFILEENDPGIHFWESNGFRILEHFGWMQKFTG